MLTSANQINNNMKNFITVLLMCVLIFTIVSGATLMLAIIFNTVTYELIYYFAGSFILSVGLLEWSDRLNGD